MCGWKLDKSWKWGDRTIRANGRVFLGNSRLMFTYEIFICKRDRCMCGICIIQSTRKQSNKGLVLCSFKTNPWSKRGYKRPVVQLLSIPLNLDEIYLYLKMSWEIILYQPWKMLPSRNTSLDKFNSMYIHVLIPFHSAFIPRECFASSSCFT